MIRPGVWLMLGLLGLILLGGVLLTLPASTPTGLPISFLDALFTSTSASCVTGLIVRDTGGDFTSFGQAVILLLIQLGGLGIMAASGMISLMLGRGVSIREAGFVRDLFEGAFLSEARGILRFIALMTFITEALGAVVLWFALAETIPAAGPRLWAAVFHSVSAFCNAGFSLFNDSLVGQAGNPLALGAISMLLIIGGLGFTVVANLLAWGRGRALRLRRKPQDRLYLQARIVVGMTLVLLLAGTALLAAVEWNGALAGESTGSRLGLAFFQSATCRTAGFNSMDLTQLAPASVVIMLVLMTIGAGAGSTAGGLKLTTVAVLWANLRALSTGVVNPRLRDREIPRLVVRRAFMVLTSWLVAATIAVEILLLSEGESLIMVLFETVSALGTVGLSLGITPDLTLVGKLVVIVLMFLGRLGPLAVAYGIVRSAEEHGIRYPEATLMVG